MKIFNVKILSDLHVFGSPEYVKVVFDMPCVCLSVCMYVYMYVRTYVRLARAWRVRWTLIIFGIQKLIRHRSIHSKYEHSSSENRDPSDEPKTQNGNLLKSGSINFYQISVICGHYKTANVLSQVQLWSTHWGPKCETPILSKPALLVGRISLLLGI
jgi:hypothetical protein